MSSYQADVAVYIRYQSQHEDSHNQRVMVIFFIPDFDIYKITRCCLCHINDQGRITVQNLQNKLGLLEKNIVYPQPI